MKPYYTFLLKRIKAFLEKKLLKANFWYKSENIRNRKGTFCINGTEFCAGHKRAFMVFW